MIKIENLTKSYKGKKVVNNLSFEIKDGELFDLLGSNGAGKSTTIKMILELVKKDSGIIEKQQDIRIGYSPETPYFPPFLTGKEVLHYYGQLQKIPKEELETQCTNLMEEVGLEDDNTKVRFYSKGMLQRLAMAQAMLGDPEFLILDEPCAGLDAMGRLEMLKLIEKLKKKGKTILMNSHILNDMEKVCDSGIIMKKGQKLRDFTKADLQGTQSLEDMFVEAVS